jgi:phosphopantetheine adenylyltransferase
MDIYRLYRNFWDYAFQNPEKFKPNDVAIFSFAVEHCNRLGWKEKFGLPTSMVMEAVGIKSYSVYKKHFDNLVENGMIDVVEYSKNQYSSNIIALKENYKADDKANTKALDKALAKHVSKHPRSTCQSTSSIIIQLYKSTNLTIKQVQMLKEIVDRYEEQNIPTFEDFKKAAIEKEPTINIKDLN